MNLVRKLALGAALVAMPWVANADDTTKALRKLGKSVYEAQTQERELGGSFPRPTLKEMRGFTIDIDPQELTLTNPLDETEQYGSIEGRVHLYEPRGRLPGSEEEARYNETIDITLYPTLKKESQGNLAPEHNILQIDGFSHLALLHPKDIAITFEQRAYIPSENGWDLGMVAREDSALHQKIEGQVNELIGTVLDKSPVPHTDHIYDYFVKSQRAQRAQTPHEKKEIILGEMANEYTATTIPLWDPKIPLDRVTDRSIRLHIEAPTYDPGEYLFVLWGNMHFKNESPKGHSFDGKAKTEIRTPILWTKATRATELKTTNIEAYLLDEEKFGVKYLGRRMGGGDMPFLGVYYQTEKGVIEQGVIEGQTDTQINEYLREFLIPTSTITPTLFIKHPGNIWEQYRLREQREIAPEQRKLLDLKNNRGELILESRWSLD